MSQTRILIVEDDTVLNAQLAELLRGKSYGVDQCYDGDDGLLMAAKNQHQLILLDVMLPRRDGYSLLNILRKDCQTPVMMLTAKGAEEERIKGYTHGVDDFLSKPFNSTELLLRIEAILRRCQPDEIVKQHSLALDGLQINRVEHSVFANQKLLELTPIQFKLLWKLLLHQGEVLSKAFLYQTVLNKTFGEHDRSLDMHLSRVRRKLMVADWRGERLQTVHGKGYCLS
jgi:two-component system response regulator PfeR